MPSRLNPYITFDGNARDALEFYEQVFGGTLTMSTFGDMGADHGDDADKIMHGMLETDAGYTLMASDTAPGTEHRPGNNITISLSGDDAAELRRYWESLSADGTVNVPLEKQMWGDEFGSCIDRFGIGWLVNISGSAPGVD